MFTNVSSNTQQPVSKKLIPQTVAKTRIPQYEANKIPQYEANKIPQYKADKIPQFEANKIPQYKANKIPQYKAIQIQWKDEVDVPDSPDPTGY
ncbi:hypothetical protein M378DRAFT_15906 [Amanita muscaria Koide BX008]|uniref:Uncharacterized protein n=1 Tax=Amanita muscaria (strain Koide BX008) TaxID=946122 RepID=A0A0C2W9Q6_AMAMK|nr:hypothetical protein M378DRAFT_15906 [Amanita muscaria Koide BX008]